MVILLKLYNTQVMVVQKHNQHNLDVFCSSNSSFTNTALSSDVTLYFIVVFNLVDFTWNQFSLSFMYSSYKQLFMHQPLISVLYLKTLKNIIYHFTEKPETSLTSLILRLPERDRFSMIRHYSLLNNSMFIIGLKSYV